MNKIAKLELYDIQSGAVRPRPTPYAATYLLLRIDHRKAGGSSCGVRAVVASAAHPTSPVADTWVSVALTYQGLKALGVPQDSLDSFALEFQQGMAARAALLRDTGESAPEHWEKPLGTPDVHVVLTAVSPDEQRLEAAIERARTAHQDLIGVKVIWRQDCYALPTEREPFGFRDGISHPAIEAAAFQGPIPASGPSRPASSSSVSRRDRPLSLHAAPGILGRNGTYVVFRKLHQRVAAFREYLKANSRGAEDEELLAAKMMGRWRSGAPLALCPFHDDPELGADPRRNNDFLYPGDDPNGYKTPAGLPYPTNESARRDRPRGRPHPSHDPARNRLRPAAPRGRPGGRRRGSRSDVRLRRAHLGRQFEFVQSEWMNEAVSSGPATPKIRLSGLTTSPALPSRDGRSAGAFRGCRGSWSPAAASTASCRTARPALAGRAEHLIPPFGTGKEESMQEAGSMPARIVVGGQNFADPQVVVMVVVFAKLLNCLYWCHLCVYGPSAARSKQTCRNCSTRPCANA